MQPLPFTPTTTSHLSISLSSPLILTPLSPSPGLTSSRYPPLYLLSPFPSLVVLSPAAYLHPVLVHVSVPCTLSPCVTSPFPVTCSHCRALSHLPPSPCPPLQTLTTHFSRTALFSITCLTTTLCLIYLASPQCPPSSVVLAHHYHTITLPRHVAFPPPSTLLTYNLVCRSPSPFSSRAIFTLLPSPVFLAPFPPPCLRAS